jgi:phospholipid transport system substrate-binding protein
MKHTLISTTLLALLLSSGLSTALASPYYATQPPMPEGYQQQGNPAEVLRDGIGKLLRFLRQPERPSPRAITSFLENEIAPYFDFDYMATWVAGPMNRSMSKGQHSELAQQLKVLLLGTLTKRLANYQNQDVQFYRPRQGGRNEVRVRVAILRAGGYPTSIDFRFYQGNHGWKIFDVSANGNSALAYYRQYFLNKVRTTRSQKPVMTHP